MPTQPQRLLSRWLSVFVSRQGPLPSIDNSRRLARIAYRWRAYTRIGWRAASRVPATQLLRSHFPFVLPDAKQPPIVTLELTNVCNLACTYCTSPLGLRPRGMMDAPTFRRLVAQLESARVPRLRLVGNGEPTLHPRFSEWLPELAAAVPFVSIVSNAQRWPERVVDAMLTAPLQLVEVSVDGASAGAYEKSRLGGHFDLLLRNLARFRERRARLQSQTLLNLRVMLRPSEQHRSQEIVAAWREQADAVMLQYVIQRPELAPDDAFENAHRDATSFPRCALPFKDLDVTWNGDVPLCHFSAAQIGEPGLILGNIRETGLLELWNSPVLAGYREAHRRRSPSGMPICRGCVGG